MRACQGDFFFRVARRPIDPPTKRSPPRRRSHFRAVELIPVRASEAEPFGSAVRGESLDVPSPPPPEAPVALASVAGPVVVVVVATPVGAVVAVVVDVVEGPEVVVEEAGTVLVVLVVVVVLVVELVVDVLVVVDVVAPEVAAVVDVVVGADVVVVEDEGTPDVVVVEDVVDSVSVASQHAVLSFGATSNVMSVGTSAARVSVKAATSMDVGLPMHVAGKVIENC